MSENQLVRELPYRRGAPDAVVFGIDVKNLEKGIKNLKKPGFNPKNKKTLKNLNKKPWQ